MEIQMANMFMRKRHPTSWTVREMQVNTTVHYLLTPVKMAAMKMAAGESVKSMLLGGKMKWYSCSEEVICV